MKGHARVGGTVIGRQLVQVVLLAGVVLGAAVVFTVLSSTPAWAHAGHDHLTCVPIPGVKELCTHGPDAPPAGVDIGRSVSHRELQRRAATGTYDATSSGYTAAGATTPKIACIGDGTSGARVQAIYARAKDKPDRFSTSLPLIRKYAAIADSYVNRSAAQVRSGRRIRYVTQDCQLKVLRVTLSARGDDSFGATTRELANKGYNKSNRKYLIWMDANVAGMCGVGSTMPDDRAALSNDNNQLTGFARVDRSCWGGGVEAHELFHTFGAVQYSAPHSNKAGHCYDEYDAMCYVDHSGVKMRVLCATAFEWQIDCGHNDYFNPKPKAGTYLDKKWNTADTKYLEPAVAPPTEPVVKLPAPANRLPGLQWSVSATSSASGNRTIARWKWEALPVYAGLTAPPCRFSNATAASTKFWCDATFTGQFQLAVTVWDNTGLSNVKVMNVAVAAPSSPRATKLTLTATPSPLPVGGGTVKVVARLVDVLTTKPVIGMPVDMDAYDLASYAGGSLASRVKTSTAGTVTRSKSITTSTRFTASSWGSPVWKQATAAQNVSVPLPSLTSFSAAFVEPTVAPNGTTALGGAMSPRDASVSFVELQKNVAGEWVPADASAEVKSDGTFQFGAYDIPTATLGAYEFRVVKPAGAYARAVTAPVTLTVAKLSPTITVSADRVRMGDGSVRVTATVTPAGAAELVKIQRNDGGSWADDWYSSVRPEYDAMWNPTGALVVTTILPDSHPLGTYTYRLLVPNSAAYDATATSFSVTYTTGTATITIDAGQSTNTYGDIVKTGSVTPAGVNLWDIGLERLDGTQWVADYAYLEAVYDSNGNPTSAFKVPLSAWNYPAGSTQTFRLFIRGNRWISDTVSDPFTATFPP